MEFIHGESLEKRLERANAPLLESEVLDWAVQICDVLTYLHGQPQPVIFRDLKPSNVMVTLEGRVKLIDFGIARTYKSASAATPSPWGPRTMPRRSSGARRRPTRGPISIAWALPCTICSPTCRRCRPLCPPRGCPVHNTTRRQRGHRGHHRAGHVRRPHGALPHRRGHAGRLARQRAAARPPAHGTALGAGGRYPQYGGPAHGARRDARACGAGAAAVCARIPVPMAVPATPHELVTPPAGLASLNPPTATAGAADLPLDSWEDGALPAAGGVPASAAGGAGVAQAAMAPAARTCPQCQTANSPAARYCRHCGFALVPPLPPALILVRPPEAHWDILCGNATFWWGVLEAPRWWTWTWLSMIPRATCRATMRACGRQSPLPAHRPGERQRHLRQRRAVGAPRAPPVAPGRPPAPGAGGARISYSLMAACERRRGGTAPSAR